MVALDETSQEAECFVMTKCTGPRKESLPAQLSGGKETEIQLLNRKGQFKYISMGPHRSRLSQNIWDAESRTVSQRFFSICAHVTIQRPLRVRAGVKGA